MPDRFEPIANDARHILTERLRDILETLGMTRTVDEHFTRTPENVADFWLEFFEPFLTNHPVPVISTFPARELAGQMVLVRNLSYHSLCAHHLTPFFGMAHVAYIPAETGIGIGAPAKLMEHFARRPQLQERLAAQVADALVAACQPQGVAVLLTARQMCMEMRGERSEGIVECLVTRGCFAEPQWRELFLERLKS
ncbi:MAG: GTP cyclohydrolase I [Blastocatellia bacterium]|nr:GTP cyclohydrolase I [Blastocatellia bacterium]